MIVISEGLVLSATAALGPNNPVIGWRNLVTFAGISADEEAADHPATNLANDSTNLRWQAETTDEQYLTFDVETSDEVDYVGIARHNLGSGQVVVSIEYPDPDSPEEWLELVGETLLADDAAAVFRFVPTFLSQIRIRLQPGSVIPRAAVVYVGELLVLPRRIYVGHTPITLGRATSVITGKSYSGDFLGRIVESESISTSVNLQNLEPAWYRTEFDPFVVAAKQAPFFFAWRPSSYPREVGYSWLTNDPQPSNQRTNGMMQVALELGGVAS